MCEECPICYIILTNKNEHKLKNCTHKICNVCYNKLLEYNINLCPVCRTEINNNELTNIIIRNRRRNITREEKIFNKTKIKQRMRKSRNNKFNRFEKLNNCIK